MRGAYLAEVAAKIAARRAVPPKEPGLAPCGPAPYGYRWVTWTQLAVVLSEARQIQEAARLMITCGWSAYRVFQILEPTRADGQRLTRAGFYGVLRNPVSVGRSRRRTGHGKAWAPAILAEETWDAVQASLARGRRAKGW